MLVMKDLRPIGNDAVRDKVEHLQEEVNLVSRKLRETRNGISHLAQIGTNGGDDGARTLRTAGRPRPLP
jgi:hypothetical protein